MPDVPADTPPSLPLPLPDIPWVFVAGLRVGPLFALMLHSAREMLYLSNDTSGHSSGNGPAEKNSIGSGSGRSDLTDPKNRPVMALADGAAEEEKGKGEEEKNLTDDVCSRSFKLSPTIPRGMGGSALPPLPPQSYETIPTLTLPYYAEVEPMAPTNDETSPAPSPNGASTAWVRSSQRTSISNVLYDIVAEGDTNEAPSSTTAWVRSSDRASISNVLFDIAGGGADERPPSPFAAAATLVRVKVRQSSVTSVIAAADDSLPPTPVEAAHVHVEVAHRSRQQGLLAWAPDGRRCQLEALGPLFEEYRTSSPLTATFFLALVLRWVVHGRVKVWGQRTAREESPGAGGGAPSCSLCLRWVVWGTGVVFAIGTFRMGVCTQEQGAMLFTLGHTALTHAISVS